jgi:hypothetical protein
LMVLENSNKFYAELWEHFGHKKGPNGWNKWEQQFVDKEMCDWLETKGCKWVKVCAQPGDLILWDSVSQSLSHVMIWTLTSRSDVFTTVLPHRLLMIASLPVSQRFRSETWSPV